ncbi:EAL domain-containing protein [Enterobacter kobei]|uniref:EAL domain-containing protein n=1 Tax=Enterobacter kobei TaxID=208224 RepID=UPI003BC675CC
MLVLMLCSGIMVACWQAYAGYSKDFKYTAYTFIFFISVIASFLLCPLIYKKTIEYKIKNALKKKKIYPLIQPIVCADTGKIVGGEVLMRWRISEGELVPPELFIPIAESNGMIKLITTETFRTITKAFFVHNNIFKENIIIFFNVSSANFEDEKLLNDCNVAAEILHRYNVNIGLEVTERTFIEGNACTRHITEELRRAGVVIALDDFGTGNSNYLYIKQFEPNFIKIDKAFISEIDTDKFSKTTVQSMLLLGKGLECRIVAEGIETESQKKVLLEMGVDYLQGYLFSKPIPLSEFFDKVKGNN